MAAALTTPFDVVKTFRQIELGEMKQSKLLTTMFRYFNVLQRRVAIGSNPVTTILKLI